MKNILAAIALGSAYLFTPNFSAAEEVTHVLRCESDGFAPQNCSLPVAPRNAEIKEIRKIKQLSSRPCIEGKTWAADTSDIMVRDGCRAEFLVVYRIPERSNRHERWNQYPEPKHRQEDYHQYPDQSRQNYIKDPSDIVIRSFEDIYNRRPSREEMRFYRGLIIDRGWTERQIRDDLRHRGRSGNRY